MTAYQAATETKPVIYIKRPLKSVNISDLVQPWYADFVNAYDMDNKDDVAHLCELANTAHYMDIKPLLDLTCSKSELDRD